MNNKVLIIGAGIAGLSAGCYLQMNGYETEIFELNTIPGGLCTSWDKNGYTIDGCIHWLVGSSPKDSLYNLWNELVDMNSIEFRYFESYLKVFDESGRSVNIYSDLDKLEDELISTAPEDTVQIKELLRLARKFLKFELPVDKGPEVQSFWDKMKFMLRILPFIGDISKTVKISSGEYSDKFSNPLLKLALKNMFQPRMALLFNLFIFKWFHLKTAGYPIGGSLNFAKKIEDRYISLGGKIHYHSKVSKIITEGNKATGILLEKGLKFRGDIIISAADGHFTLFEMLEGRFISPQLKEIYANKPVFPSYVQISLGIKKPLPEDSDTILFKISQKLQIDPDTSTDILFVKNYRFDTNLSPKGKTLITIMFTTENHSYWEHLRQFEYINYKDEKKRLADEVIKILTQRYGLQRSDIDMVDVSTPATVIRFTNNWKGSFEGWILSPEIGLKQISKELPGLKNFYMAGQWVEPGGGLPAALMSGRNVAQLICKKAHVKFNTKGA